MAVGDRFVRNHVAARTAVSNTTPSTLDLDTAVHADTGTWSSSQFTATESGLYLCMIDLGQVDTASTRAAGTLVPRVNGVDIDPFRATHRYIRNQSGAREGAAFGASVLDLSVSDTVELRNPGTIGTTEAAGEYETRAGVGGSLQLLKLPDLGLTYIRRIVDQTGIGQSQINTTRPWLDSSGTWTQVTFDTETQDDDGLYSGTGGDVTLAANTKYLVAYGAVIENYSTSTDRKTHVVRLSIGGVNVQSGSGYDRGTNEAEGPPIAGVYLHETGGTAEILKLEATTEQESTTPQPGTLTDAYLQVVRLPDSAEWIHGDNGATDSLTTALAGLTTWDDTPLSATFRADGDGTFSIGTDSIVNDSAGTVPILAIGWHRWDRDVNGSGDRKTPWSRWQVDAVDQALGTAGAYSRGQQSTADTWQAHYASGMLSELDAGSVLKFQVNDPSSATQADMGIYASASRHFLGVQVLNLASIEVPGFWARSVASVSVSPVSGLFGTDQTWGGTVSPASLFVPGDTITGGADLGAGSFVEGVQGGIVIGTNEWPAGEAPSFAIDDDGNKHLNSYGPGSGVVVSPSASGTIATSIKLWTANDEPKRDPASFEVWGKTGTLGASPWAFADWTLLASGAITLPTSRQLAGTLSDANSATVGFSNTTTADHYLIVFPTLKGTARWQSGEIRLFGVSALANSVSIAPVSGSFTAGVTTWTAAGTTVDATPVSGSFTAGAAVWAGTGSTVDAAPVTGSFTAVGVTWVGGPGTVDAVPVTGSFDAGAVTWDGATTSTSVTPVSGLFEPGAATWTATGTTVDAEPASDSFTAGVSTWVGNAASVDITPVAGSFTAGGATWVAAPSSVDAAPATGSFAPGGVTWVGSGVSQVGDVAPVSGSFIAGAVNWAGATATVNAEPASDSFTAGVSTWAGTSAQVSVEPFAGGAFDPGGVAWTGNTASVSITPVLGVLDPGVTIWAGRSATVDAAPVSGTLDPGVTIWAGLAITVEISAGGAFDPGGVAWTGASVAVDVAAVSDAFGITWPGTSATVSASVVGAGFVAGVASWESVPPNIGVNAITGEMTSTRLAVGAQLMMVT